MPKIVSAQSLDRLVDLINSKADGISAAELLDALGSDVSLRTLQRRLAQLIAQGRIAARGAGRDTRYLLASITGSVNATLTDATDTVTSTAEIYVPISAAGAEIKQYVCQAAQQRRPVGYRIEFLDAYEPNVTAYLDETLRKQLHVLGRSPANTAPAGTFARDIFNRLLIDLSWSSSRLEGNTYSRLDTERLIQHGEAAQGKDAIETQMILNHKAAIDYLVHDAGRHALRQKRSAAAQSRSRLATGPVLNEDTIVSLHALLSDGLLADPLACGRLRDRAVEIGGSVYRPLALPQRLQDLFAIVVERAAAIADPFEQSFFLMVHLPYLQPFEDVNKRASRLAANIPLIRCNLSPLSFIDVPEAAYVDAMLGVYELNRIELLRDVFVWAYERSCQQYVAVRSQLVPPDMFRLRHRLALGEAIRALVRAQAAATPATIRKATPSTVEKSDRAAFAMLVAEEMKVMHAGNAVRFGLRPLEFEAWRSQQARKAPRRPRA